MILNPIARVSRTVYNMYIVVFYEHVYYLVREIAANFIRHQSQNCFYKFSTSLLLTDSILWCITVDLVGDIQTGGTIQFIDSCTEIVHRFYLPALYGLLNDPQLQYSVHQ